MSHGTTGTFSFTLSAEWDFVPVYNRETYLQNQYAIPLDERLDIRRVIEMLLASGDWEPFDPVRSITIEDYLNEKDISHRPLFSEYLYFNSHMRRLIYNQSDIPSEKTNNGDFDEKKTEQAAKEQRTEPKTAEISTDESGNTAASFSKKDEPTGGCDNNAKRQSAPVTIQQQCTKEQRKYAERVAANGDPVIVLRHRWLKKDGASYHLFRYCEKESEQSKKKKPELMEYILPINSVELRIYAVGVLLLTIRCQKEQKEGDKKDFFYTLCTYKYSEKKSRYVESVHKVPVTEASDLSWIESCGRRLYASRMTPCGQFGKMASEFPVLSYLECSSKKIVICDFRTLLASDIVDDLQKIQKCCQTFLDPKADSATTQPERFDFLSQLISPNCISKTKLHQSDVKSTVRNQTKEKPGVPSEDLFVLDCFNDDRMYVHGSIISEKIYNKTVQGWKQRHTDNGYLELKDWYAILYADYDWTSPTLQDPDTLVSLVEQATDARWYASGTLHGMTYHSMLMLTRTEPLAFLQENNDWHYLQMFLVVILQRCSIQRFYREASGLLRTRPWRSSALRTAVQNKYTLFLNQFWFFEVTEQEQGKHLFDRLQKAMNIQRDVEFLDGALEEINQQNTNNLGNMVNKLLLPLSIIGGLWAVMEWWVNFFNNKQELTISQWPPFPLIGPPKPHPVLTIIDILLRIVMVVALIVCIAIYVWNQGAYLKHSCKGLAKELKRHLQKIVHKIFSIFKHK